MVTDWKEKKLGDIAEIRMCKRIFADQTSPTGEIPFFKIGTFGKEPDAYISRALYDEYRSKSSFPNTGDVLLSAAGTLGRTVVYDGKPAYFQDSNIVWLEIDESQICNEYLNHCYQVMVWASPEGSTISRLYNGIIRDTDIQLPPIPEQRAIAAALSDVDGYISALERLITKKRNIKQGAMQELLTGKRRLPGFSGEWMEKPLGSIADVTKLAGFEFTAHIVYEDIGKVIALRGLNVKAGHLDLTDVKYIDKSNFSKLTRSKLYTGDMLFTYVGTIGDVALVDADDKYYLAPNVALIRFNERDANPQFMLYQFMSAEFQKRVISPLIASTTQSALSMANIRLFNVLLPSPTEQTTIAALLSDMDAEIDALTAKLAKMRNIKQGMMQELLTGRIRLTSEEVEPAPVVKPTAKVTELPKCEPQPAIAQTSGHNQQFDDAVMIAGIVNALYSDKYPLGRKKVQKCLYLLRRHQDESTAAFKKKAAGPYADEVRYKGGEPIARSAKYIVTTSTKGKGTTFARGGNITQALGYIKSWGRQADIKWLIDKLKFKKVDDLELLATVDMAICDLEEVGIPVSVPAIKHLIATNTEWKAKLKKQSFSDDNIARAIKELQTLL